MSPDEEDNLVYIDGEKCWRWYRFGGFVTLGICMIMCLSRDYWNHKTCAIIIPSRSRIIDHLDSDRIALVEMLLSPHALAL